MTLERWQKILALIVTALTLSGILVTALKKVNRVVTSIETNGTVMQAHVVAESTYHRTARVRDSAYRRRMDSTLRELHGHVIEMGTAQEAQLRGECIENPKNDLARQGLLAKCRALGIDR